MPSRFFVTGTDTGVGKTVVSATLCAALDAIYWKPVQTGTREGTDRATVMRIAGIAPKRTAPEVYRFSPPVSPHLAARLAGKRILLRNINLPKIAPQESLIAEGAGGALVPLNERDLTTALMKRLGLPVLLVTRTSLGTINHTLLSVAALRAARLNLHGVIMVGKTNIENRKAIEHYGQVRVLGRLPLLPQLDRKALIKAFNSHFDRTAFVG
ncbi:MAG TPA: dethiobiotin synthase [Candidatus Acidoferrales bacterium]|nr:dethiobiotin synthase [Candidatus Acidoferrales bacterium]